MAAPNVPTTCRVNPGILDGRRQLMTRMRFGVSPGLDGMILAVSIIRREWSHDEQKPQGRTTGPPEAPFIG